MSIEQPHAIAPRSAASIALDLRDERFAAVPDAQVTMRITHPGGRTTDVEALPADQHVSGRYSTEIRFDEPGVYRLAAAASRDSAARGRAERWVLVGGADLEMADPRLNADVLRRIAAGSGGAYLAASEAARLPALVATIDAEPSDPQLKELWHSAWVFGAAIVLLTAEWTLRRRWGLR
jgi:hypothetical protein